MASRLFITLFALFFMSGCVATKAALSDYEACKNDPSCFAQMQKARNNTTYVVETAVSVSPLAPFATPVGAAVGGLAFILTGVFLGGRIRRQ